MVGSARGRPSPLGSQRRSFVGCAGALPRCHRAAPPHRWLSPTAPTRPPSLPLWRWLPLASAP
eukprot:15447578-Alexandrium_andersonii.AAC.1